MNYSIHIPRPFHLESVVKTHGWFQLTPFFWDDRRKTLIWAVQLLNDPVLLNITSAQDNLRHVEIFFQSKSTLTQEQQDLSIKKFKHIFNLDLDLNDFYKICGKHKNLRRVHQRGMGRLMRCESVYEDIFKSICGTNVQWKQAVKMINTIAKIGNPVPGTEYRVFPGPEKILHQGEKFLKESGRVGYRSAYLMSLCKRMIKDDPDIRRIENGEATGTDIYNYFLGFDGIGPVTAAYLAALYGSFEKMAVDSLVISYMSKAHFHGIKPTVRQVEDFYAKFGIWRYLAYWMEFILAGGWNPDAA